MQTRVADRGSLFRVDLLNACQNPLITGVPVKRLRAQGKRGEGLGRITERLPASVVGSIYANITTASSGLTAECAVLKIVRFPNSREI